MVKWRALVWRLCVLTCNGWTFRLFLPSPVDFFFVVAWFLGVLCSFCCSSQELLSKLGVDPAAVAEPSLCPVLSIIPRRSTVEAPAVILPKADRA